MAKRIMLYVIPNLTSPGVNYQTGGLPDYNALKLAVKGAERIIKYGTQSCIEEMEFYGSKHDDVEKGSLGPMAKGPVCRKITEQSQALFFSKKYTECLKVCTKAFEDLKSWQDFFGGSKWAKIAKTLLSISLTYENLMAVRAAGKIPPVPTDNLTKELELMKNIIVEMNIFDGLAHNSGNIFEKMVNIEDSESKNQDIFEPWQDSTQAKIKRLMDAK